MSVEEKNKLLKCLKYYDWMTEEEKQIIFAGMLQVFTTIKRVKLRAKCDLVPKKPKPREKMMDTQEQYISAFNTSQIVDDFGIEEIKDNEDDDEFETNDAMDFSQMFQGFLNYLKTTIDETIPVIEKSIDTANKVVQQSIDNVKTTTKQLVNQSLENATIISEHPLFIASLPIVSASIGSAVGTMIAGEESKKAIAQSIGTSIGRVAGDQIAISLKNKREKKTSIKEEASTDEADTPRKRRRRI